MFRNSATSIALFAFDTATGAAVTGDAANLSAFASLDFATPAALADTSANELDATNAPGWYVFDLTAAETDATAVLITATSSTSGVEVRGQLVYTQPSVGEIADEVWNSSARNGTLQSLTISATGAGPALHIVGNDDHGILVEQFGTHEAIKATAADSHAMRLVGGTSGFGLSLEGTLGDLSAQEITEIKAVVDGIPTDTASDEDFLNNLRPLVALLTSRIMAQQLPQPAPLRPHQPRRGA